MNFYKIKIAYDGTEYKGWQEQKYLPTIVSQLKKSFIQTFNKNISIVGASRTDAGVHALGQVARVMTDLDLQEDKLMSVWNAKNPYDICILSCQKTTQEFHPMKNVLQKTYFYHFFLEKPIPFNARYGWYFKWKVDFEKLNKCLQVFHGTYDFRSFCSSDETSENTVRTIDSIRLINEITTMGYRIEIKGKSFLHHMIRRVVGACLEVASRPRLDVNHLQVVLKEKNPKQTLPNANPKGLILYDIKYKD